MKTILRFAAALLASFGLALPASATTFSTDYTDIWLTPSEPGWGINIIQQYNVLFATMFIYGPGNAPTWLVASDMRGSANSYSGGLFKTTGTPYAAPWNAANSTTVQAGSISINFTSPTTGTLTYTADGATVTKQITRFGFAVNNLAGNYLGGMTAIASGCSTGAALIMNELTVTHNGNPRLIVDFTANNGQAAQCVFTGPYVQEGRVGRITGTFACSGAATNNGTFTMSEIYVNKQGFTSIFSGKDQFCNYQGFFGGTKDVF